jgi:hypothetical protein
MQKLHYSWIANSYRAPVAFLLPLALVPIPALFPLPATSQQQKSATKPITTSSLDSHDGLTVAADPWISAERYKPTFPKKSPYTAGVLAIKVTFRNDSDDSVRIGLDRIRLNLTFDDNNRQELPPLSSELLADAVLHPRIKSNKPRLPLPIPTSQGGRDKHWEEYKKLAEDASLHSSVVAPHASIEGLLYFDLQNQFDLLSNAHLYIPDLTALEKDRNLMFFDIDLSRPTR